MDIFIVILHICAVLVCILWLSYNFRVSLVETLPVFVCALVLVLYGLAMIHRLSWIDCIAAAALVVFAVWSLRGKKEDRKAFGRECLKNVTDASFITTVILLAVIAVCVYGKVVSWWDDINFWAMDVKSLYFLDGFAGKYANVSPEYGDYPPGAQLMKWWFLHFDPHVYREGLAFVGYYVMNMIFMLPLLRKLRSRNVPMMFLMAAALWFLPSIAEVYGYNGFCADLTMACIYGGFLLAVTDRERLVEAGKRPVILGASESVETAKISDASESSRDVYWLFYYGRCALYLGVLVLIKSIGFVWALFGLIFMFLYLKCGDSAAKDREACKEADAGQSERTDVKKGSAKKIGMRPRWLSGFLLTAALPVLTGGSWMLFCLLMRRITRTTATAVKYVTTDEYGISGYTREFAEAFLRAFVGSPLHKEKSVAVDLTPLGFYLCICLLVVLFYKARILSERKGKIVLWFAVVSGAVFYGIIFVAHITIFATETQYLEAAGMISSIERYGAPFTVGTLIFLAGIWLEGADRLFDKPKFPGFISKCGAYLCLILFVALTAGYQVGYDGLVGYRDSTQTHLSERADMIGEDEARFLDVVQMLGTDDSTRVCYIRRGDAPRWVNNSYAAYEASPVSMMYKSVNLDDAPTDWMVQEIRSTHAEYLYAEKTDADAGAVFDRMTQGGAFSCETLYRISDDGTEMKLTQVSQ
ncbi:MAG: hypothetical protein NC416_15650 [Eubacterium sp.]|nr:hypothetical protein [Eubacterium sp.]